MRGSVLGTEGAERQVKGGHAFNSTVMYRPPPEEHHVLPASGAPHKVRQEGLLEP